MIITIDDFGGEAVTKVCDEESWMGVIGKVVEGLKGFGFHIPEDRERFIQMLSDYMEENK